MKSCRLLIVDTIYEIQRTCLNTIQIPYPQNRIQLKLQRYQTSMLTPGVASTIRSSIVKSLVK